MNDTTRKKLGIPQELMASWLGVARSTLAQVETGRRSLPRQSILQHMRLHFATEGLVLQPPGAANPASVPLPPLPAPPVARQPLERRLTDCRHLVRRLRYELETMRRKAEPYEARLKALPALRAWTGPVANPAREENWLLLMEGEAEQALQYDCGAGPQRLLEARLAGLEREAELLEQLLAELPEPPLAG